MSDSNITPFSLEINSLDRKVALPGNLVEHCKNQVWRLDKGDVQEASKVIGQITASGLSDFEIEGLWQELKQATGMSLQAIRKEADRYRDLTRATVAAEHGIELPRELFGPSDILAEEVARRHFKKGELLWFYEGAGFYYYSGKHWELVTPKAMEAIAQKVAVGIQDDLRKQGANDLNAVVRGAVEVLSRRVLAHGDPLRLRRPPLPVINCRNGEIWLTENGPEKRDHSPESGLRTLTDIFYNPKAKAPTWERLALGMLDAPGTPWKETKAKMDDWAPWEGEPVPEIRLELDYLEELLGYAIQPARDLKTFYLIVGPGDNGKTKLTKAIEKIIGHQAIAAMPLSQGMDNDHTKMVHLIGKQVLVDDDADKGYMLPDGLLKKLSEQKLLTARHHHGQFFEFEAAVVAMILANAWPKSRDASRGMATRAQVVHLERSFLRPDECAADHPDRQRPDLWERVFREEMAGVLNRLIAGYYRVKRRGGFKAPQRMVQAKANWLGQINHVQVFLGEQFERTDDLSETLTPADIWGAYQGWVLDQGISQSHRVSTQHAMTERVEEAGFQKKRNPGSGSRHLFCGIKRRPTEGAPSGPWL